MSASDAKYSEREKRTAPQSKIISILHSHNKTVVRSTGSTKATYNNTMMDKTGQPNPIATISASNTGFSSLRTDSMDRTLKGSSTNNNVVSKSLSLSQLGAEIEQSVQTLEQEMKISQNQLNYLEVCNRILLCC